MVRGATRGERMRVCSGAVFEFGVYGGFMGVYGGFAPQTTPHTAPSGKFLIKRPSRELARTSRQMRAMGWAQPESKISQSHRADFFEGRISLHQIMEA